MMKGAFSQPENIEALLLNHSQIDESQRHCIVRSFSLFVMKCLFFFFPFFLKDLTLECAYV